jgi:hypothetical protein
MAVALLALFTALSASAYAATVITGKNVRNGSLTGADIQSKSIAGTDIKDGALAARDVKPGSLTADRLAGNARAKNARWVLVNRAGQIEAQSGGFSVTAAYPAGAANGNVYIESGEDLSDNGIAATIALENQYDLGGPAAPNNGTNAAPDANPEFAGEISASRCQIPGVVECGPPAAKTTSNFVVSPRESDGQPTTGANRKKFYVVITG